jgi:hypothetical protein
MNTTGGDMATFKVEGEGGMVTLYKMMKRSALKVGIGDTLVPAKVIGYVYKERAAEVPSLRELLERGGAHQERLAA